MANVFTQRANLLCVSGLILIFILLCAGTFGLLYWPRTSYATGVSYALPQPVPFSHKHHVTDLGIDCRFCHTAVEKSSTAGMPSTQTCMKCHSQLWTRANVLEPVRQSWKTDTPIRWNRVHKLPDYVYFNHAIHVNKGVSCFECHGRVDTMPLVYKAHALEMKWCMDCHRDPGPRLRPEDQITNLKWQPPADHAQRQALSKSLMQQYKIQTVGLTNCTNCHR